MNATSIKPSTVKMLAAVTSFGMSEIFMNPPSAPRLQATLSHADEQQLV